jgi:hypothetical protein
MTMRHENDLKRSGAHTAGKREKDRSSSCRSMGKHRKVVVGVVIVGAAKTVNMVVFVITMWS